eukprot:15016493-Ditylum_brightwellii.AAC.1
MGSRKYSVTKEVQERHWEKLQQLKENGFTCGSPPPIYPYIVKQQLRCYDNVKLQWYQRNDVSDTTICSFCCSKDDVLSSKQ